jgi:hypothetical protein
MHNMVLCATLWVFAIATIVTGQFTGDNDTNGVALLITALAAVVTFASYMASPREWGRG